MTTGGPGPKGPQEGAMYSALRQLNEQYNLGLNDTEIYSMYVDLKNAYHSGDQPIIVNGPDGRTISTVFLTDFLKYAQTGTNPYQGGAVATGEPAGTTTTIPDLGGGEDTGGSGLSDRQKEQRRQNTKAGWRNLLVTYGLDPDDPNLQQLVNQATRNRYNNARFLEYLRQTPEYREQFRGIFDSEGNLKMSEQQYIRMDQQFESIAAKAGLNYTDSLKGFLFRNDVSVAEASARAMGIAQLKKNPALFEQFSAELQRQGVAAKGEVTKKNLLKFVMGDMTNKEWANLWQDAAARYQAVESGLKITQNNDLYAGITRQQVLAIADKGFSSESMAQGFQEVADQFIQTLPLSEAGRFGLDKKDILQATFGGPHAAQSRAKIKRVLETNEAFYAQRANPQVYTDESGGVSALGNSDNRKARSGY